MSEPQKCDIEDQCTHFCVYKQRICPVYARSISFHTTAEAIALLQAGEKE